MPAPPPHIALLPPLARRNNPARAITYDELLTAYQTMARIVARYGDKYLPLFERLERELEIFTAENSSRHRAAIVAQQSLPAPQKQLPDLRTRSS